MDANEYSWKDGSFTCAHDHLMPTFLSELRRALSIQAGETSHGKKIFDLGCGNGSVASHLYKLGYSVTGVDPSTQGIEQAKLHHPECDLHVGSAYEDLPAKFGRFSLVYSLEVVEHVYSPRVYANTLVNLLEEGGTAIVSTPYHGYWKNLAMALAGKMDAHFTALWDHGHIKFWSVSTLTQLFSEVGLEVLRVHRVGRVPPLAKSMILILKKSQETQANQRQ